MCDGSTSPPGGEVQIADADVGNDSASYLGHPVEACETTECALLPLVVAAAGRTQLKVNVHKRAKKGNAGKTVKEMRMLYIGTHPCPVTYRIRKLKIKGFGVDAFPRLKDPNALASLEDYCRAMSRKTNYLSFSGINQRVSFRRHYFAFGWAAFVLEFMPHQLISRALNEWKRTVRQGLAVSIRSFDGEKDTTRASAFTKSKGLPPPLSKSASWWEGVFREAGFAPDEDMQRAFDAALNATAGGAEGHSGRTFFLTKIRRKDYGVKARSSMRARGAVNSELTAVYDSSGMYDPKDRGASEAAQQALLKTASAHGKRAKRAARAPPKTRRRREREGFDAGSPGAAFSPDHWSRHAAKDSSRQDVNDYFVSEGGSRPPQDVAEAKEDMERLAWERANYKELLAAEGPRSRHRKRAMRRSRSEKLRQRHKRRGATYDKVKHERDAITNEMHRRKGELANAESDAVGSFRTRHAARSGRDERRRDEQRRRVDASRPQFNRARNVPLG